jgi:endonuclease III-like uncharacterized protein
MGTNSKHETIQLKAAMIAALQANEGNVKIAAEAINISEQTHYRWCREDNTYNNAVGSIRDIRIRHMKEKLLEIAMKKIEEGNITTLNKMLSLTFKNFHEEIRLSNFYNDDPYEVEEEEDE